KAADVKAKAVVEKEKAEEKLDDVQNKAKKGKADAAKAVAEKAGDVLEAEKAQAKAIEKEARQISEKAREAIVEEPLAEPAQGPHKDAAKAVGKQAGAVLEKEAADQAALQERAETIAADAKAAMTEPAPRKDAKKNSGKHQKKQKKN
ncbi:hypothetical protein, partial [Peptococcus niger]